LFNARGIDFIVIGAHALAFHALPRYTKDLDLFIRGTTENAQRVSDVLAEFEGVRRFSAADVLEPETFLVIGKEPNRIDLLTEIDAVSFDQAWANRVAGELDGIPVSFISLDDYLANKRATGRIQDLADAERAEEIARPKGKSHPTKSSKRT
jgi:predicted nucleotidyltransferase